MLIELGWIWLLLISHTKLSSYWLHWYCTVRHWILSTWYTRKCPKTFDWMQCLALVSDHFVPKSAKSNQMGWSVWNDTNAPINVHLVMLTSTFSWASLLLPTVGIPVHSNKSQFTMGIMKTYLLFLCRHIDPHLGELFACNYMVLAIIDHKQVPVCVCNQKSNIGPIWG